MAEGTTSTPSMWVTAACASSVRNQLVSTHVLHFAGHLTPLLTRQLPSHHRPAVPGSVQQQSALLQLLHLMPQLTCQSPAPRRNVPAAVRPRLQQWHRMCRARTRVLLQRQRQQMQQRSQKAQRQLPRRSPLQSASPKRQRVRCLGPSDSVHAAVHSSATAVASAVEDAPACWQHYHPGQLSMRHVIVHVHS